MQTENKQEEIFEIVRQMLHDPSVSDIPENHRFDMACFHIEDNCVSISFAPKWILTWPNLHTMIHGGSRFASIFLTCHNIVSNIVEAGNH